MKKGDPSLKRRWKNGPGSQKEQGKAPLPKRRGEKPDGEGVKVWQNKRKR